MKVGPKVSNVLSWFYEDLVETCPKPNHAAVLHWKHFTIKAQVWFYSRRMTSG